MTILSENRFFRPLLWPTVTLCLILPLLIGLGVWQMQRLEWKRGLIAELEERAAAPTTPFPGVDQWPETDWRALAFRRVSVRGYFLNDWEFHVFRQNQEGKPVYRIIVPIALDDGGYVFVDRGVVPLALKEAETRPASWLAGEVLVEGVVRTAERTGMFDVDQNPKANEWTLRQPAAFAKVAGLEPTAPVLIEASSERSLAGEASASDWPIAEPAPMNIANDHFQYALTWFSLAIGLVAVYLAYHSQRGRFGRPK